MTTTKTSLRPAVTEVEPTNIVLAYRLKAGDRIAVGHVDNDGKPYVTINKVISVTNVDNITVDVISEYRYESTSILQVTHRVSFAESYVKI